ncbi:hypothetical protein F0562_001064 [Nyssa sinensis]|uniref:Uncharacterized protein n=1 Tax=Nyssa sinensis TaxID=561372 RepID=A0A5J5C5Y8_9ASTE|nr:hypothetical protein F0562_001064 [Nyssa sinensis]
MIAFDFDHAEKPKAGCRLQGLRVYSGYFKSRNCYSCEEEWMHFSKTDCCSLVLIGINDLDVHPLLLTE